MRYLFCLVLSLCAALNSYCQSNPEPPTPKQLAAEKAKAAKGNADAMVHLGMYYYHGSGVVKNYATSRTWLQKAVTKNNVTAMLLLGAMYEEGDGVKRDLPKAIGLFKKAAEKGNADAAYELGSIYEEGEGIPENMPEAVKWYKVAADSGIADAMISLGFCYMEGDGVVANKDAAINWFMKAADKGDQMAMRYLGEYFTDIDQGNDCVSAMKWYMKAADAGDTQSVKAVGVIAMESDCKGADMEAIAKWMKRNAGKNYGDACFYMAGLYIEGKGVTRDPTKAMDLLMKDRETRAKTAEQRNQSTNNLFTLYTSGDLSTAQQERLLEWMELTAKKTDDDEMMAVIANIYINRERPRPNDYSIAMDWAQRAADKGNPNGCFWVGLIYSRGLGEYERNDEKAFAWMMKAADKGDKDAMKMIATFYEKGMGVPKDADKAAEWNRKAGTSDEE